MASAIPQKVHDRYEKLKKSINHYRHLYHVEDKEEISPEALDSLKDELVRLENEYPSLVTPDSPTQRIAGTALAKFQKVVHKVPQWSLNDAFTEEDIREFDARVKRMLKTETGKDTSPAYICELKIDGLHVVLEYVEGKLVTAATRGDGSVGENVTHNIRTIQSVPLVLVEPVSLIVEGEVWLSKEQLVKINREREKNGEEVYANPRNLAAGTVRQLDPKIAAERKLDTFIYDISEGEKASSQKNELEHLRKLGFKVNTHYALCASIDEVIAFWQQWHSKKDKQTYLVDGVVVKVNEASYQEALGYTGKGPRFSIAIKFPAEQATTVVENIHLQVGRTGAVTPVAHLRPVRIAGSTIARATLHNEDQIKRLDVRVGDTVVLQKAGDVIPEILSVITALRPKGAKAYVFPKTVDGCGGNGEIERVQGEAAYRCVTLDSAFLYRKRLYHFVSKTGLNVDGVGPKIIDALLDHGLIQTHEDLFTLNAGDIAVLEGFKEKSAQNIVDALTATAKQVPLHRLLVGLSIDHVGEETGLLIAEHFRSLQAIEKASLQEVAAIYGVGEIVGASLVSWMKAKHNRDTLQGIQRYITIVNPKKEEKGVFSRKTFVFTGSLTSLSRDEAKELARSHGAHIAGSVSKNTDYVVVGEEAGTKAQKARSLGVAVLTEQEFLSMLKKDV